MIKFEHTDVYGFEHAIRGMRNPMNSWNKSDSKLTVMNEADAELGYEPDYEYIVGKNDLALMQKLIKAGTDHRKFMRMIAVWVDITAPLYWWKESDTYKVGTVANSTSTMHKIHAKEFTLNDFSHEYLINDYLYESSTDDFMKEWLEHLHLTIGRLNKARELYNETKEKIYWWQIIELLPSSYNQKRTVMLNYEVLKNMYHARKNHKLDEWHDFCAWIETLPYAKELIVGE